MCFRVKVMRSRASSDVTRGLDIHSFDAGTYRRQLPSNAHFLRLQKLVVQKPFPDLVRHVREIGLIGIAWGVGHGDVLKSGRDTGDESPGLGGVGQGCGPCPFDQFCWVSSDCRAWA